MKYSSSNKPLECMMTQSTCYKGTKKMTVKGVLWHSTGANNPALKRYVQPDDNAPNRTELLTKLGVNAYSNDWNHIYHEGGMNCWIGKLADGTVTTVQTLPWDYRPWGCGSGNKGSCNDGWIQFEICEDALTDSTYFNKVYQEACEITAYLCKMYNIDPHGSVSHNGVNVPTILCHADSHSLGLGSGHADINHWFPKFGKSMSTVRNDVAALLKSTSGSSNSGSSVTPSSSNVVSSASATTDITAGTKLNLQNIQIYGSSSINTSAGTKTGTYYAWSNEVINGRICITNSVANVGKLDQVTGWINYADAKKSITSTASSGGSTSGSSATSNSGSSASSTADISAGTKLNLQNVKIYGSSTIKTSAGTKTGVYYAWSKDVVGGRIRITNNATNVGKPDQVTGWIDYEDAKKSAGVATSNGSKPYTVKVATDYLNIRKGAGINYAIVGAIKDGGIYTIVDEATGAGATKWGLLKSYSTDRNGWISLDYCKKV